MVLGRFARNRIGKILDLATLWHTRLKDSKLLIRITKAASVPIDLGTLGKAVDFGFIKKVKKVVGSHLLYSSNDVPELDEDNFMDYLKTHKTVFVMWYDPLCPVCKKSMSHFERLYNDMKGSMSFGLINAMANQNLAMRQDINAFPTFRLYRCNGKCRFKHHEGGLDYYEMKSFISFTSIEPKSELMVCNELHGRYCNPFKHWTVPESTGLKLLIHRSSIQFPHSLCRYLTCSAPLHTIQVLPKQIKVGRTELVLNENVMEVTGNNFDEKIKAFENVLVYFYTTWCLHCGRSLGEFLKAADLIEDAVGTLAICNGEDSLEIVDKYYVGKIPTLKFFRKGRYITDYIGDIKAELLVKFMKDPHIDEEFLLMVTRHKPFGDLHEGLVFTPTQKRKMMWSGKDGSGMIKEVNNENIDRVLKENPSLLLLFYTCWSRICVGLKHDYINVSKAVEKTDVVLAAVDCEENVEIADRFLIHKFPTIKYFRDGQHVRDFTGDYHSEEILKFLRDPSKLKISPKVERPSPSLDDEGVPKYWKGVQGGDKILHFTDFNYKQLLHNNPSILLMFYVPWCKPCTIMKREFAKAATQLDPKKGILAACDAERNNEMADMYSVIKLPTLKYLKNGEYVRDYTGQRKAEDFLTYMENPPEKRVLTPLSDFK